MTSTRVIVHYVYLLHAKQPPIYPFFFFFNDTATTEIYTLSLHDALPILPPHHYDQIFTAHGVIMIFFVAMPFVTDRKSTRLNSSHGYISYAVFCLKKKKIQPVGILLLLSHEHPSYSLSDTCSVSRYAYTL